MRIPGYKELMRSSDAGLLLLGLALIALLAISAAAGASPAANVKGSLVRASSTGGCLPGDVCDPIPPAAFVVFTRSGHATRARLAANGAFAVHLASGLYAVSTAPLHAVTPATLRVPRTGIVHPRLVERNR
jgi:hypothetical protein